ncbi:hypothetical protein HYV84_05215 [Candidatus Woesearchaeota archaeon]|nr:hypothetical protein [Candidatus Woesearchaeota archaeon]
MTIYRAVDDRQRGAVELTAAWMSENDQTLIAGKPSFNEQVPVKLSFLKRLVFGDRYGYLDDFLLSGGVLFVTHPAYSQTCAEKVRVYDVHSCALDLSVKKSLWPSQRWGTADTGKALYFSGADGLIYIVVAGGSPPDTEVEDYRDFKVDLTSLIEAAISPFAESKKKKVKSALTPYDSTSFPPFGTSVPGAYTPLPPSFYPDPQNPGQVIHTEGKIGGVFIDDQILRNAELGYRLVNHGEPRLFRLTANNASDIIKNATIGHNGFQRRLSTQLARDRFKPHMVLKVDGPVLHQSQLLNMASRGQKYGGETLTEQDILLEQWVTARPTHRIDISISSAVPTKENFKEFKSGPWGNWTRQKLLAP